MEKFTFDWKKSDRQSRIKVYVDILLCLSIGGFLTGVLVRSLPYPLVGDWSVSLLELEHFVYPAFFFFILRSVTRASLEHEKLFVVPLDKASGPMPPYLKKDYAICGAIFIFSTLYLLAICNKSVPSLDEGFILTMSDRVLRGEVPYKDFFLLMTPGAIYLNAWIFQVFGATVLVERIETVFLGSLATSMLYFLVRRGAGFFISVCGASLFLVWQFPLLFQANYSWFAAIFSMAAFWATSIADEDLNRSKKNLFLIGLFCGMGFIMKQNTGAYTFVAIVFYLAVENVAFSAQANRRSFLALVNSGQWADCFLSLGKCCGALFLGFVIPFGLTAYVYASKGYLPEYLQAVLVTPLVRSVDSITPYAGVYRITVRNIMSFLPQLMMLLTLGVFLVRIRTGRFGLEDRFPLLLLFAAGANFLTVYPRADFYHILFTLWPCFVLLAYWVQQGVIFCSNHWRNRPVLTTLSPLANLRFRSVLITLLSTLVFAFLVLHKAEKNIAFRKDCVELAGARGKGIYYKSKRIAELNGIITFINGHRGCGGSEAIFSTSPSIYFLTGKPNVLRYDYILSGCGPDGYVTEIVRTLDRVKPCLAILDRSHLRFYPLPSDWWKIQDYIFKNYRILPMSVNSRYIVMRRKIGSEETVEVSRGLSADSDNSPRSIASDPTSLSGRKPLSLCEE